MSSRFDAGTFAFTATIPIALTVLNAARFAALVDAVRNGVEADLRSVLYARLAVALRARADQVQAAEDIYWGQFTGYVFGREADTNG